MANPALNYSKYKKLSVKTEQLFNIVCHGTGYLPARKSLILSLWMMASLKVYAPDLGLRTALITFVQFLASAAAFWSLVLIAVLAAFAIVVNYSTCQLQVS